MLFRQPFSGDYPITLKFGDTLEGVYTASKPHMGTDYTLPMNTPVLAASDGTVWRAGEDYTGYGIMVLIRHADGGGTLYAHLNDYRVAPGQIIKKGEVIGYSGNSGNSTGPHLHFEARTQVDKSTTAYDGTLTMRNEVDVPKEQQPKPKLKSASELPQAVRVVAPRGVKVWQKDFAYYDLAGRGTQFVRTGETIERNGYTFVQCYRPSDLVWVAVHDEDTQILDE